jgi:plastocyanin
MPTRCKIPVIILMTVTLAGIVFCAGCASSVQQPAPSGVTFLPAKNVSHVMDMMPPAGATYPGVPLNVVIDMEMNLTPASTMSIQQNGMEYGMVQQVDDNRVTLRRYMDPQTPNGVYTVNYSACWENGGTCEDGMFQFAIDRSLSSSYVDWRGQREVTIHIRNEAKDPRYVIVSPGTTVTWANDDKVPHTADSDSHMTHSYYPDLDSGLIEPGMTFSHTFNLSGVYPTHCSEHPETEHAIIIVE